MAVQVIQGFAHHLKTRRPLVTLKLATSLDGKTATRTGESQWITNESSRAKVHEMRRQADALVTGIGTVIVDKPRLTARNLEGNPTGRPLLRVVVDTDGRMPSDAPLLAESGDVLWVVGENTDVEPPTESVMVHRTGLVDGKVDLEEVVKLLGSKGLHNVMIEAGAGLAGAVIQAGLVDKISAFIAPKLIGGSDAPGPIASTGISSLGDAVRLKNVTHQAFDGDILVEGYVVRN